MARTEEQRARNRAAATRRRAYLKRDPEKLNPPPIGRPPQDPARRFAQYVGPDNGPETCLEWTGNRDQDGYGIFYFDGKNIKAHRFVWFTEHGTWPPVVLHRCDNPPCLRLAHLAAGTNLDNIQDRTRKGRTARGDRAWKVALTEVLVLEIRKRYAAGGVTQAHLAAAYATSQVNISRIVRRKAWSYLDE